MCHVPTPDSKTRKIVKIYHCVICCAGKTSYMRCTLYRVSRVHICDLERRGEARRRRSSHTGIICYHLNRGGRECWSGKCPCRAPISSARHQLLIIRSHDQRRTRGGWRFKAGEDDDASDARKHLSLPRRRSPDRAHRYSFRLPRHLLMVRCASIRPPIAKIDH